MNKADEETIARLAAWADALAAWRIPDEIMAGVKESPWVLPTGVFSRRAERMLAAPRGASYERALEALGEGGSVLDVGAGGGAASLPLAPATTRLTAVDTSLDLLDNLAHRAAQLGLRPLLLHGNWPQVARAAPVADVVVCHHVLYNVADLEPFVIALTGHAARRVVVEMTERHPLTHLNPYWKRFHGIERPERPTADEAVGVLRRLGLDVRVTRWRRPATAEYPTFDDLVEVTRRRLCLPPERAGDVATALREHGVSEDEPPDLGSSGRDLVTLWWPGGA
jgi:SAM-dependent methyltransferase